VSEIIFSTRDSFAVVSCLTRKMWPLRFEQAMAEREVPMNYYNYYAHSGGYFSPRPNRTGAIFSVLIVLVFISLFVFGIVSTYDLG